MEVEKPKQFPRLSDREEEIGKLIVDSAFQVHKALGPGLLEKVYEACFAYELSERGLSFQRQIAVPIDYKGLKFDEALRLDILVEELVVCEIKTVDVLMPVHQAQLLSYLKLTNKRLGYLINFHVPLIKDGIHRFIH